MMSIASSYTDDPRRSRRSIVKLAAGVGIGIVSGNALWRYYNAVRREPVFIGRATSYSASLEEVVSRGFRELGIVRTSIKGKSVVVKPNLVEPSEPARAATTHPAMVHAVVVALLQAGAREVCVAEGSGHSRDPDYLLDACGIAPILDDLGVRFIDLNYNDIVFRPNKLGTTTFAQLALPRAIVQADLIVTLAKMKTHHWAGVTLTMKNCYGCLPGIYYGWPKNILHHHGIAESILDVVATIRPALAIIDGIVGMEGDGPLMGAPKSANVIVMGRNVVSTDATATRVMGADPATIQHLAWAHGRLGPITESLIDQRGESLERCATVFQFPRNLVNAQMVLQDGS